MLVVLGVALTVAVLWVIGMLVPSPTQPVKPLPPNPFDDPKAGKAHIEKLARQYGDNFDLLSNDDKIFLNAIAMGHGRELLAKTARELKSAPAAKPEAVTPDTARTPDSGQEKTLP